MSSSLGEFLHLKCDGSHEHSPCSGRNTSDTERYIRDIAKAVHLCFSRDTRLNNMNRSDDASVIMPGAISVFKLPGSDEFCRRVKLIMAKSPPVKVEAWPGLKVGAASKPIPRSRKWGRSKPPDVEEGDAQEQENDEDVDEQKLDASGDESPNAGVQWERTGPDQKVVMGLAGQWRALENAKFVPKQGDRRQLMYNVSKIAERDLGAMYEWLKDIIISCRFTLLGQDSFRGIKLKTIAMPRKMLDPDGVCGVNVEETRAFRELAKRCSSLFANVAGELICQWTEGDDNEKIYFPSTDAEATLDYVNRPVGEDDKEDLKCSGGNVSTLSNEAQGSKPFVCLKPLSRREVEKLDQDSESVVMCPHHGPERVLADCVYCHAGQQQLVERAEAISTKAEAKTYVRGITRSSTLFPPRRRLH